VTSDPPRPLPVRVRPIVGESAESYIRRLARANHLKPSYLRRHLATPQGSYGPIQPDQLAALAGHALPALLHALPDLAGRPRGQRRHTRQQTEDEKRRNQTRKRARFAAIRRDAAAGLSRRAIERSGNDQPEQVIGTQDWVAMFRAAGFVSQPTSLIAPVDTLTIYRGAPEQRSRGMAWSTDIITAERHRQRCEQFNETALLYTATVQPSAVLALFHSRREEEVVLNPQSSSTIGR
jgi:TniQ